MPCYFLQNAIISTRHYQKKAQTCRGSTFSHYLSDRSDFLKMTQHPPLLHQPIPNHAAAWLLGPFFRARLEPPRPFPSGPARAGPRGANRQHRARRPPPPPSATQGAAWPHQQTAASAASERRMGTRPWE